MKSTRKKAVIVGMLTASLEISLLGGEAIAGFEEVSLAHTNFVVRKYERASNSNGNDSALGWRLVGYTDLVLLERSGTTNNLVGIWTNTHPVFASADQGLSQHAALDAVSGRGYVFVCYKEGPALLVEQILPPMRSGRRERYWLGRDTGATSIRWTYAAFRFEGSSEWALTATNNVGDVVTWTNGVDHKWKMDQNRSKPVAARVEAQQEWTHLVFETNRWIVTERHR